MLMWIMYDDFDHIRKSQTAANSNGENKEIEMPSKFFNQL